MPHNAKLVLKINPKQSNETFRVFLYGTPCKSLDVGLQKLPPNLIVRQKPQLKASRKIKSVTLLLFVTLVGDAFPTLKMQIEIEDYESRICVLTPGNIA